MENSFLPVVSYGITKTGISELVNQVVDACTDGVGHSTGFSLKVAEQVAAASEFIKQLRDDDTFLSIVRDELAKHKGGFTSPSGAKMVELEAGVKYDYSSDPVWVEMKKNVEYYTAILKNREDWLKKIPAGAEWPDPTTGELITAPLKSSTSTYSVKLPK